MCSDIYSFYLHLLRNKLKYSFQFYTIHFNVVNYINVKYVLNNVEVYNNNLFIHYS